jgi:FdhE protein
MAMTGMPELRARRPEWAPWLSVVDVALCEIRNPAWQEGMPRVSRSAHAETHASPAARLSYCDALPNPKHLHPLLDRLVRAALASQAPSLAALRHARYDARASSEIFKAALNGDDERLDVLASQIGTESAPLRAVASLLPLPWLQAFRREQAGSMSQAWSAGYCPCCGSWPALAKVCGIERVRYLGCGRCGHSWEAEALNCPYCGMRDHEQLGMLLPQGRAEQNAIEVCKACEGYVKALRTLGPGDPEDALIADLSSVELDLAATARGYHRPSGVGCRMGWEH